MRELVIDRATWFRGRGPAQSRLLTDQGKRCCLGFECQALGYKDEQLIDVPSPGILCSYEHPEAVPDHMQWLADFNKDQDIFENSITCLDLIAINDNPSISDPERESQISEIFANNGVEVKFIN